ncbi:MAG: cytochrome P450 [Deltaproteobacteria bacterium]|nr:cytochrome P450 [Deltaproteobacteria bacterium]
MLDPKTADFALDEMPGAELHDLLRAYREQGPIQPTRLGGLPAFVISEHEVLKEAFVDEYAFPGHLMYEASFEPAIGKSFISMSDAADHLRYRKLATPAFRSRAVASYEREGLAALAHELVDGLVDQEEFDLVGEFTQRFPYLVTARLLGIPREREEEFHGWAVALLSFRDNPDRAQQARESISEFLAPIVEEHRREPRNDVISELIHAEVDGRRLSDDELFSHIRLLFPTGSDTTHGALGNLLYALFTHEGAWQAVCRDSARIDLAVVEALRWETPIAVLPRMSRDKPIEFHGTKIPPKSWVLFAIAGANRDPALFETPDRFDVDRAQPPNLVFGRGEKSCPGIHLAQKNMSVALQVLSERLPDLELVDAQAALPRRTVLRSPDAVRVRRTG